MIREYGGFGNWTIVIVERMENCKDSEEARTRERYWYEQLNANLYTFRPIVTDDEMQQYKKEYRENNKDKILITRKKYYETNKDEVIERNKNEIQKYQKNYREENKKKQKEYYELNKQKILDNGKKPFYCRCGSVCRTDTKSRHLKTPKHLEFIEKIVIA